MRLQFMIRKHSSRPTSTMGDVLEGLCLWSAIHAAARKCRVGRGDDPSRGDLYAVSLVHSLLVAGHSAVPGWVAWDRLLAWMAVYFLYDLAWSVHRLEPSMVLHHLCAAGVSLAVRGRGAARPLLPALCAVEVSTVFLNVVFLLRHRGLGRSRAALVAQALFAASFVAVRILWLPRVLWREAFVAGGALAGLGAGFRAAAAALAAANFWWLRPIARQALRAARPAARDHEM